MILLRTPKLSQFAALQQSVEELSQNMQALLQTAQEMLQSIQTFLDALQATPTQDAENEAPHVDASVNKRRDRRSVRQGARRIYADFHVHEGGQTTVAGAS